LLDAAEGISSAGHQVSLAASQQADATSSIAASVEELTVSISTVASSTTSVHDVAVKEGEEATAGVAAITQLVQDIQRMAATAAESSEAAQRLGAQTDQIASIVNVIKDIADQTNLLALNAAIEAARAGEQGRGFAVVADEVRKLAERTTQSTHEIGSMISQIVSGTQFVVSQMNAQSTQVASGVTLAQDTVEKIRRISEESERVLSSLTEVNGAMGEQSQASMDIAKRVEHIAQMGEESSAGVQQISLTIKDLKTLAQDLNGSVAHFKV
jgi:methyl-accepting chemotaxis protein